MRSRTDVDAIKEASAICGCRSAAGERLFCCSVSIVTLQGGLAMDGSRTRMACERHNVACSASSSTLL